MLVRCFIIVMMFCFSWNSAGTWHSTAFFVLYPVWYGKIKYTANNIKLLHKCVGIHIFPEMAAEISDKLIHVRHISVLVSFLVYGAVNNIVCLTLYGERQICNQHGYPEFLKDRVFRVATKIGQSDLFFDKFVIFLHRPS